jgi:N-acyl-D-amino-acid deacylase
MLDVVIRHGTVLDGSGAAPRSGDVAVKDGRIVSVAADTSEIPAAETIDATGRFVVPGFIDIHSHSDYTLLRDPRAMSAVHQGVTLEVVGNCGHGCFPVADPATAPIAIYGYDEETPLDWQDAGGYFARLESARPAVNVASLAPHGQLRLKVMGLAGRPAGAEEIAAMKQDLEASLEQGAWGFSTGLEYPVERASARDEITALCQVAARAGALYATHTRARDAGSVEAVAEAIDTARASGVRLQISHLLPRGGAEDCRRCVELVDRASDSEIGFDMHTRLHGLRYLQTLMPAAALEGGRAGLVERLRDPTSRDRLRRMGMAFGVADWGATVLFTNEAWPEYSGRSLQEISEDRGDDEMFDTVCELLAGAAERTAETLIILTPCYTEAQQCEVFSHPLCAPGSDATTLATDGPLAHDTFHGAYSWAAWFYRFMVSSTRALSPEAAVHKLTALPASRLGLRDRGILREGAHADIVVLDPLEFRERATDFEPNQLAVGAEHVLVNGISVLRDGSLTGQRAGKVLRRA